MVLALMVQLWVTQAGCTKDTDCKGDRVCEAGVCVSPKPAGEVATPALTPPPPPPAPPAAAPLTPAPANDEWPRVVRRDGLVCVQSLGTDGRIEESCRPEKEERVVMPTKKRARLSSSAEDAAEEPRGRFVMDFILQSGALVVVANTGTVGTWQLNGLLDLGGRLRSGIGFVGFVNVLGTGNSLGSAVLATVGPALRFGNRSHFLLGSGVTYAGVSSSITGSSAGVAWGLLAQGVFAIAGAFGLSLGAQFSVDLSGVLLGLSAGIALGAF